MDLIERGIPLAELLIVVAIVLVLVAIAIPVFTSSLHNSHVSADQANCRSLYADVQADYLGNAGKQGTYTALTPVSNDGHTITLTDGEEITLEGTATVSFTAGQGYTVTYACVDGHDADAHTWGVQ
ncbi:MAG: hypothetical protein Q4D06_04530 [Coriobacteriia bacterium]|nr:hypothetical protein [Coriobacteriia bacterium]